ncbi:plasmid recombination protein [Fournierella massiliensis]|nr:plasmid recombination protein [Fournierella massiliensis]MCF2557140.1 plasmid recombination protein [Fournierella massiliensis]
MVGKGSLKHNSREFYAPNVDPSRSHLNVEFCKEDIRTVYHELFDTAQQRYNAKQTRSDRRIADYYTKISSSKQEKPFHEIVLQIGNKDDTGIGSETAELARQCLEAYVHGFQARNHTLRMFSAHLHMDEATPHVHIDFVPYITGSKRGMDTRVSLKQALAQMGFVGGTRSATEWNLWVQREKQVLADIMQEHGIEWEQLGTHEEHLSVLEYKKQERSKEVRELDSAIAQKRTEVEKIEDTLQAVQKQVVDLDKIEAVSTKKALLSDRVTLPRSDFENLLHAAKQYVVYRRRDEQLQKLLDAAREKIRQLESMLNRLKEKVNDLTKRLGEQTFQHRQALMVERAQRMQMEKENVRLKREKAGMAALLHKHGIAWKEKMFEERDMR